MVLVSVEGLVKSYGKVLAVNGLSLSVDEGTIMGLIGPNGAGKTTTIKVLLGLLRRDKGKVEVFGQDPWDNPDIKPRIGAIYEKANFPPNHKILDYLKKTCRIFGCSESRAGEILDAVGLKGVNDRPIKALSAGMMQKFSIAHALVHEPEFVIADEPTAHLDPQARTDILNLILRLNHDEKTSFLISSHILPELSRVCDTATIISRGKVWGQGRYTELLRKSGVGATRISTDKPEALAKAMQELRFVKRLDADDRGISVVAAQEESQLLYEEVPKLARRIGAKIFGIETESASLEELFRIATKTDEDGS